MKYQGSANYSTWAVSLWLNNDKGLHDMGVDIARNGNRTDHPRSHTADALKEYTETVNPLQDETGVFADLLKGALSGVDWCEIADGFLEVVNYAKEKVTKVTDDLWICEECGKPIKELEGIPVLDDTGEAVGALCQKCYDDTYFTCGCGQVCRPQDGRLWKGIQYCGDCESRLYESGEIPEGNGGNRQC